MKDRLLNITGEDVLLDNSIKNFLPPEMPLLDHSFMSFDNLMPTAAQYNVLAGARLDNLFLSDDSIENIMFLAPNMADPKSVFQPEKKSSDRLESKPESKNSFRTDEQASVKIQPNPMISYIKKPVQALFNRARDKVVAEAQVEAE